MHVGAQLRGLRAPCERFAPWVTPGPRITRFRLAADLGRMGLDTHRVSNKVSKITSRPLVPLDRAFPAHTLMQTFGAELTGNQRTLPRTQLLRQLRRHRTRAAFRGEATRRDRVVTAIRQARLTGIRVAVPSEALEARLSGLPAGVSVEPGRIEVRFSGAKDAVGRLFALAQALTHDYEQFEALVEEGDAGRGGGAGRA